MNQVSNSPTESQSREPNPDPIAEIFNERAMAALMKGPAGWLWRAEWVEKGLAATKKREEKDDTPEILKGWRRL